MLQAKLATPKNHVGSSVFQFGSQPNTLNNKFVTTQKVPRVAKRGEVVYSESGSPILQSRMPPKTNDRVEKVEITEPDGNVSVFQISQALD